MSRAIATATQFSFSPRELSEKLLQHIKSEETGYWRHQFDRFADRQPAFCWNLGIKKGQIIYSGNRSLSAPVLLKVMERYVPRSRSSVKLQFEILKQKVQEDKLGLDQLLEMIAATDTITATEVTDALRAKILNDLDIYLLIGSGSAEFIPGEIDHQLPVGFEPIDIFNEAAQRQLQWTQLRVQVPSMKLCPVIDRAAMTTANLSDSQRQQIEKMVQPDKSLNSIAEGMAKDNFKVAQMFAKLAKLGLVKFQPPQKHTAATVMVIDDSPVLLSQFNHWVTALGYVVTTCQDAKGAISAIKQTQPSIIFIDINMPEISGFELVKQIRQQPDLRGIPLTILTGEQKLSNKWRAQWSGCEFLTKPLTTAAISDFQVQLEELIPRLLDPTSVSKVEIQTT